jgi:hypothetical protein
MYPLIASLIVLAVTSGMTPARTGSSHNTPHAHPFWTCAEQPIGDQRFIHLHVVAAPLKLVLTKSVTPSL